MITNLIKEEEDDKLRRAIVRGVASIIRSMMLVMLYKTIIFQSSLAFDDGDDAKLAFSFQDGFLTFFWPLIMMMMLNWPLF